MKTKPQAKSSRRKPSPKGFTLLVKERLLLSGDNISELARRIGFARNTVSRTINHPTIHPQVKERIARDLKLEVAA
jgi:hypothetical protein